MERSVLIRSGLSEAEWARVKKLAERRGLHAQQLVGQTLRETLLRPKKAAA